VSGALTRYRVLAYTTGVALLILVLVGVPLQIFADNLSVVDVVGPLHGFLFFIYLLSALELAFRARFHLVRTVLVMVAGTVPFLSFVAERNVTHQLRREHRI
jgi:integral membrane protein